MRFIHRDGEYRTKIVLVGISVMLRQFGRRGRRKPVIVLIFFGVFNASRLQSTLFSVVIVEVEEELIHESLVAGATGDGVRSPRVIAVNEYQ